MAAHIGLIGTFAVATFPLIPCCGGTSAPTPIDAGGGGAGGGAGAATGQQQDKIDPRARALAAEQGEVLVMVRLDVAEIPPARPGLPPTFDAEAITRAADGVLAGLPRAQTGLRRFSSSPFLAFDADAAELDLLAANPVVVWVRYYAPLSPRGAARPARAVPQEEATALIEADRCWGAGLVGEGVIVVVVDTGVDDTAAMLSGRVIAGGEFVGGSSETTTGSTFGEDPSLGRPPAAYSGWNSHGTRVAGVVAGSGKYVYGVAPSCELVSLRVTNDAAKADYADIVLALEKVLEIMDDTSYTADFSKIGVVNLSMARDDSVTDTPCEDPLDPFRYAVTRLVAKDVLVVTGTGNDYARDGVSFPACVDEMLAAAGSSKEDELMGASNWGEMADLLAPGKDIYIETEAGIFELDGTSYSAAIVSGSLALLKQCTAGAAEMHAGRFEDALKGTGLSITPSGSTVTRNRIDVWASAELLCGITDPEVPPDDEDPDDEDPDDEDSDDEP